MAAPVDPATDGAYPRNLRAVVVHAATVPTAIPTAIPTGIPTGISAAPRPATALPSGADAAVAGSGLDTTAT